MSKQYPLYPELTEEAQQEAMELLEKFKNQMHNLFRSEVLV